MSNVETRSIARFEGNSRRAGRRGSSKCGKPSLPSLSSPASSLLSAAAVTSAMDRRFAAGFLGAAAPSELTVTARFFVGFFFFFGFFDQGL